MISSPSIWMHHSLASTLEHLSSFQLFVIILGHWFLSLWLYQAEFLKIDLLSERVWFFFSVSWYRLPESLQKSCTNLHFHQLFMWAPFVLNPELFWHHQQVPELILQLWIRNQYTGQPLWELAGKNDCYFVKTFFLDSWERNPELVDTKSTIIMKNNTVPSILCPLLKENTIS